MTVFCVICLTGFTYSTLCYSVSLITEGCSRRLDGASEGQEGRGTGILTCDDGLHCWFLKIYCTYSRNQKGKSFEGVVVHFACSMRHRGRSFFHQVKCEPPSKFRQSLLLIRYSVDLRLKENDRSKFVCQCNLGRPAGIRIFRPPLFPLEIAIDVRFYKTPSLPFPFSFPGP